MRFIRDINFLIFVPSVLICTLSILMLYSFDQNLYKNQLTFFLIGLGIFFLFSRLDYLLLLHFWKLIYAFCILLLILTFIVGKEIRGSTRWLSFGIANFQPSELGKIVLILALAGIFSSLKGNLTGKDFVKSLAVFCPLFLLVFFQPDLGTSLIILVIFAVSLIRKRLSVWYFVIAFIIFGFLSGPIWSSLKEFQRERILTFINPSLDPQGSGYNVIQSMIAVGSGQSFGKGFGQGTQSRLRFLPEYYTDFIFASFAEEWGFVGVLVLFSLFTVLFIGILKSCTEKDLICSGVLAIFLFHFFINVGMNVGIMPVTGIPLPFMSYGGSSLLTNFMALGIVNSVWRQALRRGQRLPG